MGEIALSLFAIIVKAIVKVVATTVTKHVISRIIRKNRPYIR